MKKGSCVAIVLGLLLMGASGGVLAEDKYPSRPIELVVPFGPGGTADLAARCYSDDLSKLLKVPVNVVNRPGGTGIQGTTVVVNGKKDGYTILGTTDTPLLVMPVISKEVPYDPLKDFIPIGRFVHATTGVAVKADSPFKTLKELIDYARQNPGKLKSGAAGVGAEAQFNLMALCSTAKIKVTTIPFKSGNDSAAALMGGHVDLASNSVASLGAQIKSGKLRFLAIFSDKKRHPDHPDVPTTGELGYPGIDFAVWTALFVPTGVPKQVIDVLTPAVEKVLKNPEVIKRAENLSMEYEWMGPEELRKHLASEMKRIKVVAEEAGIIK